MNINPKVLQKSETRALGLQPLLRRRPRVPDRRREITPDEIRRRQPLLAAGGAIPSRTELERMIGANDLVDEFYLERALLAAHPVCRILLLTGSGSQRGAATGFMVSPNLLLTNWHVFETREDARNALAEFNYRLDVRGAPMPSTRFQVRPDLYYTTSEPLDYALVAIAPVSLDGVQPLSDFSYHRLIPETGKAREGDWMTIIQHPNGQPRQFSIRENELLKSLDLYLWYTSDTAPGSSGAPVFNDSFQIVALHHSGKARMENGKYVLRDGRKVASLDAIPEGDVDWVANEGVRISVLCKHLAEQAVRGKYLDELFQAMQGGDIMSRTFQEGLPASLATGLSVAAAGKTRGDEITIPLQLHVNLSVGTQSVSGAAIVQGSAAGGASPATAAGAAFEKMAQPIVDSNYPSRKGYDPGFLGISVPLPTVKKLADVAKMEDGKHVIPYEHFSVVVHKARRLALFTASNVDFRPEMREPEPGKDYTRKGLTGLGENDIEEWVTDPRIPELHQLPDKFYTKDGGAFDKGHIVRRDDMCWGSSYEQVRRANGDTYHTTNCSPQVAGFNQSAKGKDNWGDLENHIGKEGKIEKYCVFAGPVLDPQDREFAGVDKHGKILVRIPTRFWKVVVARAGAKLLAFAFLLEQDLENVPLEFSVTAQFRKKMISIASLQKLAGNLFSFPAKVKKADQFATKNGNELLKLPELRLERFNPRGR